MNRQLMKRQKRLIKNEGRYRQTVDKERLQKQTDEQKDRRRE